MTLPVVQAVGSLASGGNLAAVSPAWPTHVSGDIAILVAEGFSPTLDTASGFAAITGSPFGSVGYRLGLWWCRATSSAMAAPTVSSSNHCSARIITFRGVIASGDPWDVIASTLDSASGTSKTHPAVTTTLADCLVAGFGSWGQDNAGPLMSGYTNGNLSGIAEQFDEGITTGDGGGTYCFTGGKAAAGNTGTTTYTSSVTTGVQMVTLALKAAPSTAIKTVDDLAIASVKTVNDLIIASIKNIDGLA